MNRRTKVSFIVLSLALVAVVAVTGITALLAGGSTGPASVSDSGRFKNTVEYTVYDANGNVKYTRSIHNDINADPGKDVTVNRLIGFTVAAADLFSQIAAFDANHPVNAGQAWANVSKQVGGADTSANNGTVFTKNPAAGVVTASTGGGGSGTVNSKLKNSSGTNRTILGLGLVKTAVANAPTTDVTVPDDEVFAAQNVSITLADGDTLEVTWTVSVTGTSY